MTESPTDQAAGLRQLLREGRPRTIAIASAFARAGCSAVAANLAASLARAGRSVLVVDWDERPKGERPKGAGWLLGVDRGPHLLEVVRSDRAPQDFYAIGSAGVRVIRVGGTMAALAGLSPANEVRLEETMEALWAGADVVIIDAAPNDLPNCAVADDLMLVTQADAHSMTETYRLVKRLTKGCGRLRASVLINRIRIPAQADRFFGNLSMTATQFLGVTLELGGRIPYDECMERATLLRQPVVEAFPSAPSSKMLLNCAETLLIRPESGARQGGAFVGRLIAVARALREPHSTVSPARSMGAAIQFNKIAPG